MSRGAQDVKTRTHFFFRLVRQRHANGVSNPLQQQCPYAHSRFNKAHTVCTGLGNAHMQRVIAPQAELAVCFHHHGDIGGFDRDDNIVEIVPFQQRYMVHRALHQRFRRNLSVFCKDLLFQAAAVYADADGDARLARRVQHGIFGYTDPKESYKQAIVDWMTTHHAWTPSTKALTITPGVVFALATAVRCFTEPGDAVLLQQPVYYPFSEVIRQNRRLLVNSPLVLQDGHYEIDFADFEDKIIKNEVKLFLLCSPHNPAGRVWTREELLRIASICLKHSVLIVSDEIHEEFMRPGFQHTPLASLSPEIAAQTITCTSPSKTFNLAGLQISNIFIENAELRKRFRAEISAAGYSQPNALGLFAAQVTFNESSG